MKLYIIRHAQSENNALWERTGSSEGRSEDPLLTKIGKRQAMQLARFLSRTREVCSGDKYDLQNRQGFFLTHIYTSLMVRAVQTGDVIAQALDMPLLAWTDLHEEGGIYLDDKETGEKVGLPGKNRIFYERNYPRLVLPEDLGEDGWWGCRPYEAEACSRERARRVFAELLQRHGATQDRVAWITHGGFYNHFMAVVLGIEQRHDRWFCINNGAITRLDFDGDEIALIYQNRLDYLPLDLVT